ncbi:MAG: TrbG/VirB9 family P-type conjugative transfer protein [Rickettsiales bacterium]|jgi:type IV secretion system protein VirB9|nr:TrbG/VirB9 family P-type conjugative transfer protein [Rickettsiales bacterium]
MKYAVIFFVFLISVSQAVQIPRAIGKEKRFKTLIYNPNDVYRYTGYYLNQGYLEFEKGESIQSIALGDSVPWLTQVAGNKLFLKPIDKFPQTTMTVFTDKRVYYFELDAQYLDDEHPEELTFYVKFVYPTSTDKTIVKFNVSKQRDDYPDLTNLSKYNFNYEFAGSPNIVPVKVFDDGVFTYMEFQAKNAEVPAVFAVNDAGFESLINFRVIDEYVVIEEVTAQFTLRSGSDVVCVYNNSLYKFR